MNCVCPIFVGFDAGICCVEEFIGDEEMITDDETTFGMLGVKN